MTQPLHNCEFYFILSQIYVRLFNGKFSDFLTKTCALNITSRHFANCHKMQNYSFFEYCLDRCREGDLVISRISFIFSLNSSAYDYLTTEGCWGSRRPTSNWPVLICMKATSLLLGPMTRPSCSLGEKAFCFISRQPYSFFRICLHSPRRIKKQLFIEYVNGLSPLGSN